MVANIGALFGYATGKNNWENSIPKSVNKPVRWVVLTTALDILVTKEFWSPMAKSKVQTTMLG